MFYFIRSINALSTKLGIFRLPWRDADREEVNTAFENILGRLDNPSTDPPVTIGTRISFHVARDNLIRRSDPVQVGYNSALLQRFEALEARLRFQDGLNDSAETSRQDVEMLDANTEVGAPIVRVTRSKALEASRDVIARRTRSSARGQAAMEAAKASSGRAHLRGRALGGSFRKRTGADYEATEYDPEVHVAFSVRCNMCAARSHPRDCFYLKADLKTDKVRSCTHCRRSKRRCIPYTGPDNQKLEQRLLPPILSNREEDDNKSDDDMYVSQDHDEDELQSNEEGSVVEIANPTLLNELKGGEPGKKQNEDVDKKEESVVILSGLTAPKRHSQSPPPPRVLKSAGGRRINADAESSTGKITVGRRVSTHLKDLVDRHQERLQLQIDFDLSRDRLSILTESAEQNFLSYGRQLLGQLITSPGDIDIDSGIDFVNNAKRITETHAELKERCGDQALRVGTDFEELLRSILAVFEQMRVSRR
ncbi:hypothetical protein BDN70DRAFT_924333 [Pholiota conissans]|uniref:Uncharacterized protein n=1 Tax=Pholiota conissans TaxID=109636 RepID=A0A9P6CW63_9AGAR|nr:hypothetical protein BDN70DRAFT_924333 [Pholiota conissans]